MAHAVLSEEKNVDLHEGLPPRMNALKAKRWSGSSAIWQMKSAMTQLESPPQTIRETKGDFAALRHLPKQRDPAAPAITRMTSLYHGWFPNGVISVFRFKGLLWFISLLWPYSLLGAILSTVVILTLGKNGAKNDSEAQKQLDTLQTVHTLVGAILSFTIGFRNTNAYSRFYEAKIALGNLCFHIRELVLECYTAMHKDTDGNDKDASLSAWELQSDDAAHVPQDVRRRLNVIFAFIRQQLRESREGFLPGTGMEHQTFNASTFYMDPVRPRLWDTMTMDEVARYMNVPVHSRATAALGELKVLCQLYSEKLKPGTYTFSSLQAFKGIHDATQAMIRIRDSPVPFPYIFILNVTTFAFVYLTPFLYTASFICMFLGTQSLVFSYYSFLQIGLQLENPFGYDSFDIPLEDYGRDVHDETLALATSLGADTKTFIPQYLEESSSCGDNMKDVCGSWRICIDTMMQ